MNEIKTKKEVDLLQHLVDVYENQQSLVLNNLIKMKLLIVFDSIKLNSSIRFYKRQ